MKKRKEARAYKQSVVNAVILVIILVLFLYLGIQLSNGFSMKVSTQRTQKVTDSTYVHLDGYIFREDAVLELPADVVHYTVGDGDKVGVGQVYAETFTDTGLGQSAAAEKESELLSLSERISLLESGMRGDTLSDLGAIKNSIKQSYYAYIDAITDGGIKVADKEGNKLLSALVDYSAISGGEAMQNKLSSLIAERDALLASIGGTKTLQESKHSFNFFYNTDGYENIFHSSRLDGMTRADLDKLISAAPQKASNAIGKMTFSTKWYLAIPIDEANYETFKGKVGTTLRVRLRDSDDMMIDMLLERVYADESNPSSAYMLLSSQSISQISHLDRMQSVSILLNEVTGYKIPAEAIHTLDGQDGVYILVGNVTEFRRVTKIKSGDGYFIVRTFEEDAAENPSSRTPYLNINDMIVTSGNDLYDGKRLD